MNDNHSISSDYVRQLEILRQVDDELSHHLNISLVLSLGLDAAVRLGNAEAGAIHLIEGDQLQVAQMLGAYPRSLLNTTVPFDQGLIGRALRRQQAELVLGVQSDPDYLPHVPGMRAQMSIPLISHDRPIGILNIQTSRPELFTPEVFEFVQLLAARIAVAADNARMYEQLRSWLMELKGLYDKVSELEKVKTDMIRMAAHDLRNPLHNIQSAVELIRHDLPPDIRQDKEPLFDIVRQSIDRMRKITTDILSLERIEQSAQVPVRQPVNLCAIARQVCEEYQPQAAQKQLHLTVTTYPDTVQVPGDEAQLYEVIANLVSNAIKYTPERGQVEVTLLAEDAQAVLEVRDSGYGIPESAQARLFQPFFRAKTDETSEVEGTGLGLYMVKRIVERHGGKMRFSSVYGQGSIFGFELPLTV
ncbi:MAG: HAMP domain-containing histidine kinase [Chloroflexi bacterium]|nr:HAMP domain-containing histidine kinase [Chloroflexota bacterium]